MSNDDKDPLENLYEDGSEFDRERLWNALEGVIGIDSKDGSPIYKSDYRDLSNKGQFVAQLLYRKVSVLLGDREEANIGFSSGTAAQDQNVSPRTIRAYGDELDFVEHDEDLGGYYLRDYAIDAAINFISD